MRSGDVSVVTSLGTVRVRCGGGHSFGRDMKSCWRGHFTPNDRLRRDFVVTRRVGCEDLAVTKSADKAGRHEVTRVVGPLEGIRRRSLVTSLGTTGPGPCRSPAGKDRKRWYVASVDMTGLRLWLFI